MICFKEGESREVKLEVPEGAPPEAFANLINETLDKVKSPIPLEIRAHVVDGEVTVRLDRSSIVGWLRREVKNSSLVSTEDDGPQNKIELEVQIVPKIGWFHFLPLYLYAKTADDSLLRDSHIDVGKELKLEDLAVFLVLKYIDQLRRQLAVGLFPGYSDRYNEELPFLRGRLQPLPATLNLARGRMQFVCDYEEFGMNTPINRVLKYAAQKSIDILKNLENRAGSEKPFYGAQILQLSQWVEIDFEEVDDFQQNDLDAQLPFHQEDLSASLEIAKDIIEAMDIDWQGSGGTSFEFVIENTNNLMEAALISMLDYSLKGSTKDRIFSLSTSSSSENSYNRFKRVINDPRVPANPWRRKGQTNTGLGRWDFQPDICIHDSGPGGRHIVGDVKYYRPTQKEATVKDAARYQILYFMAVFEIQRGIVLNFALPDEDLKAGNYIVPPTGYSGESPLPQKFLNSESGVERGLFLQVVSWNCSKSKTPAESFQEFQANSRTAYEQLLSF